MAQPFTTQEEVDAAYDSGASSFSIFKSAFPDFEPRYGYKVREIPLASAELLV